MTPVTAADLVVVNLRKSFDGTPVLAGVDLVVPAGATVALLGPSGCGKTTLLRVVAGLESADAGEVILGGRTVTGPGVHVPPEKRRVGMVFQDWALFPHMTVAQNVAYGLGGDDRHRVEEILAMVGLEGLGGRMPSTLSGGQQQRVALARAIAPRPAALLLDEPFSNLDADLRARVRTEVHRLLQELGITTLFVTHDQEEAFVVGDEVAVMHQGVIEQQDPPAVLYALPATPWVAGFVGEANLMEGDAHGEEAWTQVGPVPLHRGAEGACTVLVRPEQLALEPGGEGEVRRVEFYGHDTSYRVAIPGGELMVRAMAAPRFSRGDRVRVTYQGPPTVAYPARRQESVPA
jgi:iron(III) transport system ATP-binding protein